MELSNPQLVSYCNDDLRTLADNLYKLAYQIPGSVAVYNARDLGTIINVGGASNLIDDGSAVDGRTRCTGGDVFNMVTLLQDFNTFMTQGRKDVLAKWQVHGYK